MNENLDLTKILKGCEGMTFYHTIFGNVKLCDMSNDRAGNHSIKIEVTDKDYTTFYLWVTKDGRYSDDYDGECVLFPSKDQRDWSKFERPIPIGTPMMCRLSDGEIWVLKYYAGKIDGKHRVFVTNKRSRIADGWNNGMIPFDKFDPNNIEESLKYNI